jgi:CBS domain-containing protein
MFDFDVLKISEPAQESDGGEVNDRSALALNIVRMDVPVTDIARGPALTMSPEAAVATAIESMRRRRCGAAVVVQHHRPIGVVTDRDILSQALAEVDDLRTVPVANVMSPVTRAISETDSVGTALRTMCAQRQWHLPIVCRRGLFLGALDVADVALWLRDRMTLLSVDAAFSQLGGQ